MDTLVIIGLLILYLAFLLALINIADALRDVAEAIRPTAPKWKQDWQNKDEIKDTMRSPRPDPERLRQ